MTTETLSLIYYEITETKNHYNIYRETLVYKLLIELCVRIENPII